MPVIQVSSEAEVERLKRECGASKVLVVAMKAEWCGPCKRIAPAYERMSEDYRAKAVFLRADADRSKELALALGVKALPTFVFFHRGERVGVVQGADEAKLASTVRDLTSRCSAFGGTGHSLTGSSAGAGAAPAAAAPAAAPRRRNPWADPNWVPPGMRKKEEAAAGPAQAPAPAAASPAAADPAPAATPDPAPAAAPAADPLVAQLSAMGFDAAAAQRALAATNHRSVDAALNWLLAGNDQADAAPAPAAAADDVDMAPAPADAPSLADDVAEMDPGMRDIVEAARLRKEAEARQRAKAAEARLAGASGGGGTAADAPAKKAVKDMTSEEKAEWLERRRAEVKAKRQREALESSVKSEKNRREVGKAAVELRQKREAQAAQQLIEKKKREERAQRENRRRVKEKLRLEKQARIKAREEDRKRVEELRAAKARQQQ